MDEFPCHLLHIVKIARFVVGGCEVRIVRLVVRFDIVADLSAVLGTFLLTSGSRPEEIVLDPDSVAVLRVQA